MKRDISAIAAAGLALVAAASPAVAGNNARWAAQVRQIFVAKQDYPMAAQVRGVEGSVQLKITVAEDGTIQSAVLSHKSGSPILDKEALHMAHMVEALPPPPSGATTIVVPLSWKMM